MGEALDERAQTSPIGRPASPEEIAEAIVFLAFPRSSYINAAILAAARRPDRRLTEPLGMFVRRHLARRDGRLPRRNAIGNIR